MLKKTTIILSVTMLALTLVAPCEAWANTKHKKAKKKVKGRPRAARTVPASTGIKKERYADLIIDARTGRILHETSASAERHPASLTKMMTLYITFQALESGAVRLDSRLPVSALAASQSPSKLGLRAGQSISVRDAILGLITESANDAAVALAEGLGGSVGQFAELMNKQARALGMNRTHFNNPNGLPDPGQITTARDMASLGYGLIYHYPGYYPYFSTETFRYAGRVHNNHNHLMNRYNGMDGIKTGYVQASGFNLVSSAQRGNVRLIGVVFGGTSAVSRDNQMERLMDDGFEEARATRTETASADEAQGGRDEKENGYLPLPSKVAVAFGSQRTYQVARREAPVASPVPAPAPARVASAPAPAPALAPAPAPVAAPASAPEPAKDQSEQQIITGGWGVQIGAFSDVATAQQALANIGQHTAPALKQAEPSLQKLTMSDGSIVYRARFTGLDQQSARAVCTQLIRQGRGCMVVSGI